MNQIVLSYRGWVDIKLDLGDGKIVTVGSHNEGAPYLTQVFAKFMASAHDLTEKNKEIDTPQFIDLEYRKNEGTEEEPQWGNWKSFLNNRIKISGKSYDYTGTRGTPNEQWTAHLTGSLSSYSMMEVVGPEYEDSYEFRFVLQSGYDSKFATGYHDLAYLVAPVADLQKITAGTQASISWNMELTNAIVNS